MKKKISIVFVMIACLGLSACSDRSASSIDSNPISNENVSEPSFINQSDSYENSASSLENDNSSESNSSDKNNEGYTIEKSPFFGVTLENIGKIYAYDAALGESWTVIDSGTIETIIEKIRNIVFYNETPSVDPVVETLSHQCFEYFEFYKDTEDTTPIFSMGLDPFYIEIEGEKFGPYVTDVPDGFVTELLKLFLTGR